ncbi:MAG: insulinase family protein [Alphaproteobacteria bacterium]|nr:insulinase family protein [Alphaproteobacteria bacterium]
MTNTTPLSWQGYEETRLPNGLRVATEAMPGAHSIALAISVDVGSRYEQSRENGLSHFLEHMAFKGTAKRNAREIAEAFDDVGASLNAYTSSEHTVYYARVLPKDLRLAVEVLSDILQHSTFSEEELERERNVILQEIAMHHDAPEDMVFDLFHEAVYPDQPVGRSILGTPELVECFTSDSLRRYMGKHYNPARMVISAAGAVDHGELASLIQEHFDYPSAGIVLAPEKALYVGGDKRKNDDFEQMHLVLGLPGLAYDDPEYYAAQLMATALGGGMSSRLFQEVREHRGLAYNVYAFLSSYKDGGIFGMYAAASEKSAKDLAPVLCDEVLRMAEDGVSSAELERARNQHTAGLLMLRENVSSVAEWIARHLLCYNKYRNTAELCAEYDKVTREDVSHVLRRLISEGELTCTALGPQKGLPHYDTLNARFSHARAA